MSCESPDKQRCTTEKAAALEVYPRTEFEEVPAPGQIEALALGTYTHAHKYTQYTRRKQRSAVRKAAKGKGAYGTAQCTRIK